MVGRSLAPPRAAANVTWNLRGCQTAEKRPWLTVLDQLDYP